ARGCMSLLEQGAITAKQAQRMLYFCVNAGPAFIISVVGSTLLQNTQIGLLLFFSQVAAMLVIGITLGIIARFKKEPCHTIIPSEHSSQSPLVESTLDASKGLMNMSAFVILFSAFLSLLHATEIAQELCQLLLRLHIPTPVAASVVSLLTEITSGCTDAASLNTPIALIAFGLGFGGVCVHFQIFAATLKCGVSKLKFIAFRFIHGIIAALVTMLFLPLFPQPAAYVFQNTSEQLSGMISYSWPAGISLVACCAIFLFSVGLERRKSKEAG
ncbi:MAG: sporulation protein, partial [Acutalibacteraceae bacterium]|nr:sporulation protein [Acutalibacteraceae bacterium]